MLIGDFYLINMKLKRNLKQRMKSKTRIRCIWGKKSLDILKTAYRPSSKKLLGECCFYWIYLRHYFYILAILLQEKSLQHWGVYIFPILHQYRLEKFHYLFAHIFNVKLLFKQLWYIILKNIFALLIFNKVALTFGNDSESEISLIKIPS